MYVHTPIITASDAEGAGEMFQVGQEGFLLDKSSCVWEAWPLLHASIASPVHACCRRTLWQDIIGRVASESLHGACEG